jgi:CubicO group peptidase (beta-lactamase class C family)
LGAYSWPVLKTKKKKRRHIENKSDRLVTKYFHHGFPHAIPTNPIMNNIARLLLFLVILPQCDVCGQERELVGKIDKYIHPYVETNNFSGTILISRKGRIIYHKAFGLANREFEVPNDPNTVFHIASLSKTFTAAAILLLEQKELLSTDDRLSKYVPDYPLGDKITIHHLLSHTSGITDINDLPEYICASLQQQTPETLVALFKNKPLEFLPGEKYQYTSSNYHVLALIIELVSKQKYGDFLRENIFYPLKMEQTIEHENMAEPVNKMAEGYSADGNFGLQKSPYLDWSAKAGGGAIATTANDLEKWNRALSGTSLLSDKSKSKMFTLYADSGYGWYIGKQYDKNYIYMNGRSPGFCAHMGRYPTEEIYVIVLSNITVYVPRQIAIDIAGILFNQPVEIPSLNRRLSEDESKQLVGKYKFREDFYKPNFTLEVKANSGRLSTNYGEFIPNKSLQFFQRAYWAKVIFIKDATGKITAMTIDNYRGEKID